MPTKKKRQFTREGFPKPWTKEEYDQDEIVWVMINPKLMYWPAQVKMGGTVFSPKAKATTKGEKKIPVITFNDPDLTLDSSKQRQEIELSKSKKRKKNLNKQRQIARGNILKWDAKMKSGETIEYGQVTDEYLKRMKIPEIDDIPESLWDEWHENAIHAAEQELKRMADLARLESQRELESKQLLEARNKELKVANTMKGEHYDGRTVDPSTGKKKGWILQAGDTIRYWASCPNLNDSNLIETKIIKLRDKYGTLRLKDNVPIDVQAEGNPPFWNTSIEKYPYSKGDPVYFPLKECKFIPSQIENALEMEHRADVRVFNQKLTDKGWGDMLYQPHPNDGDSNQHPKSQNASSRNHSNSNSNSNPNHPKPVPPRNAMNILMAGHKSKTKKKAKGSKRKRKLLTINKNLNTLVDCGSTTDTDIEVLHPPNEPDDVQTVQSMTTILDDEPLQEQHCRMINGTNSTTFHFERNGKRKRNKKRKRSPVEDQSMMTHDSLPMTKKRRIGRNLRNSKDNMICIDDIMTKDVISKTTTSNTIHSQHSHTVITTESMDHQSHRIVKYSNSSLSSSGSATVHRDLPIDVDDSEEELPFAELNHVGVGVDVDVDVVAMDCDGKDIESDCDLDTNSRESTAGSVQFLKEVKSPRKDNHQSHHHHLHRNDSYERIMNNSLDFNLTMSASSFSNDHDTNPPHGITADVEILDLSIEDKSIEDPIPFPHPRDSLMMRIPKKKVSKRGKKRKLHTIETESELQFQPDPQQKKSKRKKTKRSKKKNNSGGRQTNIADLRASRSILNTTKGLTKKLDKLIDRQDRTRIQDPPKGNKGRSISNKQSPKVTPKPIRKRKMKKDNVDALSKEVPGGLSPQTQSQLQSLMEFGNAINKKIKR